MNKKEIISNIKALLAFGKEETKVESMIQAEVGSYTIEVSALEVGAEVSIVTEEGVIPALSELNGVHTVGDTEITVMEGVITEVKAVEPEVEVETEVEEVPLEEVQLSETQEDKEVEVVVEVLEEDDTEEVEVIEDVRLKEAQDEIKAISSKVELLEETVRSMATMMASFEENMTQYHSKVETLWSDTPSDKTTVDFKSESKSTNSKLSNLDAIRAIRSKK
tara:strand:+ start:401 stop:1063 length:663 start_codon:yes stop_codon:yes gene_type:complete